MSALENGGWISRRRKWTRWGILTWFKINCSPSLCWKSPLIFSQWTLLQWIRVEAAPHCGYWNWRRRSTTSATIETDHTLWATQVTIDLPNLSLVHCCLKFRCHRSSILRTAPEKQFSASTETKMLWGYRDMFVSCGHNFSLFFGIGMYYIGNGLMLFFKLNI